MIGLCLVYIPFKTNILCTSRSILESEPIIKQFNNLSKLGDEMINFFLTFNSEKLAVLPELFVPNSDLSEQLIENSRKVFNQGAFQIRKMEFEDILCDSFVEKLISIKPNGLLDFRCRKPTINLESSRALFRIESLINLDLGTSDIGKIDFVCPNLVNLSLYEEYFSNGDIPYRTEVFDFDCFPKLRFLKIGFKLVKFIFKGKTQLETIDLEAENFAAATFEDCFFERLENLFILGADGNEEILRLFCSETLCDPKKLRNLSLDLYYYGNFDFRPINNLELKSLQVVSSLFGGAPSYNGFFSCGIDLSKLKYFCTNDRLVPGDRPKFGNSYEILGVNYNVVRHLTKGCTKKLILYNCPTMHDDFDFDIFTETLELELSSPLRFSKFPLDKKLIINTYQKIYLCPALNLKNITVKVKKHPYFSLKGLKLPVGINLVTEEEYQIVDGFYQF